MFVHMYVYCSYMDHRICNICVFVIFHVVLPKRHSIYIFNSARN